MTRRPVAEVQARIALLDALMSQPGLRRSELASCFAVAEALRWTLGEDGGSLMESIEAVAARLSESR